MPTLLITGDDGVQRTVALPDRTLRVGRAAENDVVLPDADKGVSRSHAELRYENGQYYIVDLQSQNGTWLNGERVARARVTPGAEIAIGLYRLRVQSASPTSVGDIPLFRPEQSSSSPSSAGARGASVPMAPPPSGGLSKPLLFGCGVALGIVAILAVRFFGASSSAGTVASAPTEAARPPVAAAPPPASPRPEADGKPADAPIATGSTESAPVPQQTAPADPPPTPARPVVATPAPASAERPVQSRAAVSPQRAAARDAFEAGQKLDAADDWLGALHKYDETRAFDASYPGLDRAVKQVWEKLRTAGTDALKRARQYDAIGDAAAAIKEYDKAAQWLPPDDPNREIARGRVERLRSSAK